MATPDAFQAIHQARWLLLSQGLLSSSVVFNPRDTEEGEAKTVRALVNHSTSLLTPVRQGLAVPTVIEITVSTDSDDGIATLADWQSVTYRDQIYGINPGQHPDPKAGLIKIVASIKGMTEYRPPSSREV